MSGVKSGSPRTTGAGAGAAGAEAAPVCAAAGVMLRLAAKARAPNSVEMCVCGMSVPGQKKFEKESIYTAFYFGDMLVLLMIIDAHAPGSASTFPACAAVLRRRLSRARRARRHH